VANPPAGWYPNPENPSEQRYWDGTQWTEHTAPAAGSAEPPPATTPGWGGEPAAGGQPAWGGQPSWGGQQQPTWGTPPQPGWGGGPPQKIDPWLWQSIVATLLCCLPAGVVGIIFAAQANSAMTAGNWVEAQKKAGQAKTWTLVAVGLGVVLIIAWVALVAVGGIASWQDFQ
jgi:hypothetical protein